MPTHAILPVQCPGDVPANGTAECPEPLCLCRALPHTGRSQRIASEGVTPPSSLLRAHASDQLPPADSGCPSPAGLCRLLPVPAGRWSFPTLSLRVFPWMLGSVSRWPARCLCPLLPPQHRPSPSPSNRSACHKCPSSDFRTGRDFEIVVIPYVQASRFACHPGRSHRWGSESPGQPWRLRPSRTCVVTFTCIGYASRPNRAIDGARTFTAQDSQPCRLLRGPARPRIRPEGRATGRRASSATQDVSCARPLGRDDQPARSRRGAPIAHPRCGPVTHTWHP